MKKFGVLLSLLLAAGGSLAAADYIPEAYRYAVVKPVGLSDVKITGGYLGAYVDRTRNLSVLDLLGKMGKRGSLTNFSIVANNLSVAHTGGANEDEWVHKLMEAAGYFAPSSQNISNAFQPLTSDMLAAQDPTDGYLNTYYQNRLIIAAKGTNDRFLSTNRFEFYDFGHMAQAGIAWKRCTGDDRLFQAATNFANLLCDLFGSTSLPYHYNSTAPNLKYEHPHHEMAMVELYRVTGNQRYLDFAAHTLTNYGFWNFPEVYGHCVQENNLLCGGADVYLESGDSGYGDSNRLAHLDAMWTDITQRKSYVTGGVGNSVVGETYGVAYELPSATSYCETCAAVSKCFFDWRMVLATGLSKYADDLEWTFYNAALPGVSLTGTEYFYVNRVESNIGDSKNQRVPYFNTSCCAPNLQRMLGSIQQYLFSATTNGIQSVLYGDAEIQTLLSSGAMVHLIETTDYPRAGQIQFDVQAAGQFTLSLRIPQWAAGSNSSITINGQPGPAANVGGYVQLTRMWQAGDRVILNLDVEPRLIPGRDLVSAEQGRLALMRGPLVYCLESPDNTNTDVFAVELATNAVFSEQSSSALGGTVLLTGSAWDTTQNAATTVTAIPYHLWANRGASNMRIWIPSTSGFTPAWANAASGLWDASSNWVANTTANGSSVTADFSQLDITNDTTVSLDSPRTIGNLIFDDLDTSSAANWIVDNNGRSTNTLMLTGGVPTIRVNPLGSGNMVTIKAALVGASAWRKTGAGTLTLAGANTYTNTTTVSEGTLNVTGAINTSNTANMGQFFIADGINNARFAINGGIVNDTAAANPSLMIGGSSGTGAGVVVINSGTLSTTNQIWLGSDSAAANFGALLINGGSVTSGSWVALGRGSVAGATTASRGELIMTGGSLNVLSNNISIGSFQLSPTASVNLMSLSGGTVAVTATAANQGNVYVGENLSGILDMSGGTLTTANSATATADTVNIKKTGAGIGIVNLRGGTLITGRVLTGNANGTSLFNFNGGTLKAHRASTAFMTGLTAAYVYGGGAIIDDGGFSITNGQALLAPSGKGLAAIEVSGGTGYLAPPIVDISGGGGIGATAAATIDADGNLTGITVTSPGTGYTGTPAVSIIGGGGSGATIGAVTLNNGNTSGGLTKLGSGTLTLAGLNTYTGNTTVNGGTLVLQQPTLATNATVTVSNGAQLQLSFTGTNQVGGLILNGVAQTPGVYNAITASSYLSGSGSLLVTTANTRPNCAFSFTGNTLMLSWPATHLGWTAQSNSGSLLNSNDWHDMPNSQYSTNQVIIPSASQPGVFYRLRR